MSAPHDAPSHRGPDAIRSPGCATLQAGDLPVHGGRTLAYVYDSGLPEVDRIGREAVAAYAGSNGLDPTAFPSLLADGERAGRLRLRPARRPATGRSARSPRAAPSRACSPCRPRATRAPTSTRPQHGAGRLRARRVPQGGPLLRRRGAGGPDRPGLPGRPRRDGRRDRRAHRARGRLRAVVRPRRGRPGAPRSPRRPPRAGCAATSTPASAAGCCRTPRGSGGRSPPWTFAVDGVTSISVDTHKYAYAPKGTSVLLHRSSALRQPQYFASADWPGYTMINSTHAVHQVRWTAGRAPGRCCRRSATRATSGWPARRSRRSTGSSPASPGIAGAATLARRPRLDPGRPGHRRHAATRSRSATRWLTRGWYVQPQMSYAGAPPTIHLSVSAATLAHVDEFLERAAGVGGGGRRGRPGARSTRAWWRSSRRWTRRP